MSAPSTTSDVREAAAAAASARSRGLARRQLFDAIARWVVTAGGVATILSITAILVFIGIEVLPLWSAARFDVEAELDLAAALQLPVVDDRRHLAVGLSEDGGFEVVDLAGGGVTEALPLDALRGSLVTAAAHAGKDGWVLGTEDGRLLAVRVQFARRRAGAPPPADAAPAALKLTGEWALGQAPRLLASSVPGERGIVVVYSTADTPLELYAAIEKKNIFGAVQRSEVRTPLSVQGEPTAVVVNAAGTRAYVGTAEGGLGFWNLSDPEKPQLVAAAPATKGAAITRLAYLIGDTSLVVGDAGGGVNVWFPVRDAAQASGWRLQLVHPMEHHGSAVSAIAASPRDRSFMTADASGHVLLHHATTERTLAAAPPAKGAVTALAYAPKANGGLAMTAAGELSQWGIFNPHPEVTLQALFGEVWYDGYEAPAYVWQSTGGTDEFEPKLSLRPLIFGTIKGTFYALLFAVPLAVLAAIYTSQFAHPNMRNLVKPVVEVMAALPSVVLGFLAGLWLAPVIEGHVPGVLAMLIVVPLAIVLASFAWRSLPRAIRARVPAGLEMLLLVPVIVAAIALCWRLDPAIEAAFFGGDFQQWLLGQAGLRFDQRNCLIVGFAMGFAVIPIIFTISEDALANVPRRLVSASLALGATAWQTALRVVVPTASPGIFSAIMVGFGRAVGETMIVLMATGNTPIFDWNIFTGMRTLSANIAVEIPEAPHGGTLYRVLFLAALLLFFATFLANTIAEVVRLRLRRRYQEL